LSVHFTVSDQRWYTVNVNKKVILLSPSGKRNRQLRGIVINLLGNKCAKCGFDDIRILQIDHIDGSGHTDRKERHSRNMWYVYQKVITSVKNKTKKFQLLCPNCNWLKRIENKEASQPQNKRATCHPDRVHVAKGLCDSCYWVYKKDNRRTKAKCHPNRPNYAKDMCHSCYSYYRKKIRKAKLK
jgi:hypothetical protein